MPNISRHTEVLLEGFLQMDPKKRPEMLIIGAALWSIRDSKFSNVAKQQYKENITRILPHLQELSQHMAVLWRVQYPVMESLRYLVDYWHFITNKMVDEYNNIANAIL